MEYRELTEQIKNGKLSPLYFLFGEEPFFIQKAIRAIIETGTDPETRDFNCDVLQGEACEGEMLVQIASSFPMMSEKRVVVLKSVQNYRLLTGNSLSDMWRIPSNRHVSS